MFCRIKPATNNNRAAMRVKPHTIRVGKFGTIPVSAYISTIGIKKPIAVHVRKRDIVPKKQRDGTAGTG